MGGPAFGAHKRRFEIWNTTILHEEFPRSLDILLRDLDARATDGVRFEPVELDHIFILHVGWDASRFQPHTQ